MKLDEGIQKVTGEMERKKEKQMRTKTRRKKKGKKQKLGNEQKY